MASTAASATTEGKCSDFRSPGQSVIRRAIPSSSMSASAVVSCSLVATSTERPASCASRQPKLEPCARSPSATRPLAPNRKRPESLTGLSSSRSEQGSVGGMFVDPNEIAEGHGKIDVVGGRERIAAERVLEPRDKDRKAERVETGIQQDQLIG